MATLDLEGIFVQVTGRELGKADREELRRLRARMPSALADSPSYMFDLVVKYHQSQQLRETIAGASDTILGDVERRTDRAVSKLVDKSVQRIHASAPSQSHAFYRATVAVSILVLICGVLTTVAIFGALSGGIIVPPWLSEKAAAQVAFAKEVEARIAPGSVDWTMREGQADASLMDILRYLEARGTETDPVWQLAQMKRCRSPSAVAFRSGNKSMCRFEVSE